MKFHITSKGAIEINNQNVETNQSAESTYAEAITPNIAQNLEVEQQIQIAKENINTITNALLHQNGIQMDIDQYENLSVEARETVNKVAEYANNLGVDVSFDSSLDSSVNGYNVDGQIVLNPNSKSIQSSILGHEITHNLEVSNKYSNLVDLIKSTTDYQGILNSVSKQYGDITNNIESEAIAKYIEHNIANDSFIKSLIKYDSSFANRIFKNIQAMFSSDEKTRIENAWMRAFEQSKNYGVLGTEVNFNDSELAYSLNNNSNLQNNNENVNNENVSESEIENEFRRIQDPSSGLSAEEYELFRARDKGLLRNVRANISKEFKKRNVSAGNGWTNIYGALVEVDGNTFYDFFKANKNYLKNNETVTLKNIEDYQKDKGTAYLSNDGLSGFFITADGDLVSVFNDSGKPGFLLDNADFIKKNAITLDCFQNDTQPLAKTYSESLGFKTTSIVKFNYDVLAEEYGKEYADNFVAKFGESDVHLMANTSQDVGEPKVFESWDEAEAYRNSFLNANEDVNSQQHNSSTNSQDTRTRYDRTNNPIDTKAQENGDYFDYGTMPVREADIVRETEYGPTSKATRTIANSQYVNDETAKAMEEETLRGEYAYDRTSNLSDTEKAVEIIKKLGKDKSIQRILNDNDISHMAVNIAMAREMENQLMNDGDYDTAFKIRKRLTHIASMSGQSTQAFVTFS